MKTFTVYHSSNTKIEVLREGSYVTPDIEISRCFGKDKPGEKHYIHAFEVSLREPAIYTLPNGRRALDPVLMVGNVSRTAAPDGEDWLNYKTTEDMVPISVSEY